MWRCTCVPRNVYDFLYPFKPLFRCPQARHFMIFCWLVVAIIRDPGVGTLKSALPYGCNSHIDEVLYRRWRNAITL
jgi:hypothetical protein